MKKVLYYASAAILVLSSCAKEMTEPIAPVPSVEGNSSVIVSFNLGDETTRTHLSNGSKAYDWDEGDVIGVYVAKDDDATNATFKYAGMRETENGSKVAEFKGQMQFLDNETSYIVYYPHTPADYKDGSAPKVQKGEKIRMKIPETQFFNFDEKDAQDGDKSGSFAQNMAPAIGVGTVEDGKLVVNLKGPASYIYFPIKGTGFIKKLELSIDGVDHLNGYNQVLADINDPKFGFNAPETNGTKTIVLNCGVEGVELDPETATNFWFVVPNLPLEKAQITVKVNDGVELVRKSYTNVTLTNPGWKPNTYYAVKDINNENGKAELAWYIDVPVTDVDYYIIDSEDKFLQYAYVATVAMPQDKIPAEMLNEGALKTAKIVVSELNFSEENFTFEAIGSEYRKTVADWYNKANGVIPTIGGAKAFKIEGDVAAAQVDAEAETPAVAAPATIKNLKIKGNGIFSDNEKSKFKSVVKNITLSGITVDGDCVLTNRLYNDELITFENVIVDEATCTSNTSALIGRAFTNVVYSITAETLVFANELNIMNDVDLTTYGENAYNTVVVHENASGAIVTVADVKKFMADVTNNAKWYSVMDKKGTSYWTGTVASAAKKNSNDVTFTAEELAYVATRDGATVNNNPAELNVNIDLMGKEWTATADAATVTVAEGKNVTISNVVVKSAYLLAETGSANGVNVKDATYINSTAKYVGGLFGEAKVDDAAKTENCSVEANHEAVTGKFGAHYGKVVVELKSGNSEITLNGVESSYGALVCQAAAGETFTGEAGNTNVILTDPNVNLEEFAKLIDWNWTEGFPTNYKLTLKKEADGSYKEVFFEFKVNNDDALNHAIGKAQTGETVTVEPGTYTILPRPQNKGVIIDAEGAVFTDVLGKGTTANDLDLNGGKLIGAEFYTESDMYNTTSNGIISGTFENCKFIGDNAYSGLYAYHTEEDKPVIFTNCEFTANTTVAQVYADKATVTYDGCTFNGYVSIAGAVGTTVKDCHFKVGPTNYAGANVWAKTSFDGCKFYFQEYDPEKEKEQGLANTFQFIAPVKQTNAADTIEFTNCQVYDSNNAFTRMTAEFEFRVPATQEGVVVKVNGKDVTLHKNVLD